MKDLGQVVPRLFADTETDLHLSRTFGRLLPFLDEAQQHEQNKGTDHRLDKISQ